MAQRCEDEFNPWPSFVDIFSSVILVMLLFLLVVLVNLGYYAQFKYKVSYTGTIATDDLIVNDNPSDGDTKMQTQTTAQQEKMIQQMQQQIQQLQVEVESERKLVIVKQKELESAGLDIAKKTDENRDTQQKTVITDEYFIVTFKGSEVFVDDAIIKKIKTFIQGVKQKIPNHSIAISAFDPTNQVSATIAKQISLSRSIGTRNLIRSLDYKKQQVKIDLNAEDDIKDAIDKTNGFLIIRVVK